MSDVTIAWGGNVKNLKRHDSAAEESCAQSWADPGAPTIRILGVRVLGDGVQVIGTILQVAGSL